MSNNLTWTQLCEKYGGRFELIEAYFTGRIEPDDIFDFEARANPTVILAITNWKLIKILNELKELLATRAQNVLPPASP